MYEVINIYGIGCGTTKVRDLMYGNIDKQRWLDWVCDGRSMKFPKEAHVTRYSILRCKSYSFFYLIKRGTDKVSKNSDQHPSQIVHIEMQ